MRHIGGHSATFELCKIIRVVADDLRTVALLPSPRTAQHQVGGFFRLSPDCLYPFRFRYLGLRVTGDRSYILLHCFNRLEMVISGYGRFLPC